MSNRVIEDDEFHGDTIILDGQKLGNFGLCSYLSLGDDPRLKQAAKDATDQYGTAYSSSITYTSLPLYQELRSLLSRIFDADVVVTGTTTLGHLAALPVLVNSQDRVLLDAHTHASVVMATDGLIAKGVRMDSLPHNDMEALEAAIFAADDADRIWYLTDGVFSMYGDTSPAGEIGELLARHPRLHVYCDDAHGFGWAGIHGRGKFLDGIEWSDRLVVVVGLSKGFGSLGGAIATRNSDFADLIELCGPALMFGGPVPPPSMGASIAAAQILLSDEIEALQAGLMERIRLVNRLSGEIGLPVISKEKTPIWFHDVGEMDDMLQLLTAIKDRGFYLNGSGFPAVPHGHAGIRFTITLDNSPQQIEDMLLCLNETRLELLGGTEVVIDLDEKADIPSGKSRS
jgi:7-keto-8-aminopelargonate synthetase-like enzyme